MELAYELGLDEAKLLKVLVLAHLTRAGRITTEGVCGKRKNEDEDEDEDEEDYLKGP